MATKNYFIGEISPITNSKTGKSSKYGYNGKSGFCVRLEDGTYRAASGKLVEGEVSTAISTRFTKEYVRKADLSVGDVFLGDNTAISVLDKQSMGDGVYRFELMNLLTGDVSVVREDVSNSAVSKVWDVKKNPSKAYGGVTPIAVDEFNCDELDEIANGKTPEQVRAARIGEKTLADMLTDTISAIVKASVPSAADTFISKVEALQ